MYTKSEREQILEVIRTVHKVYLCTKDYESGALKNTLFSRILVRVIHEKVGDDRVGLQDKVLDFFDYVLHRHYDKYVPFDEFIGKSTQKELIKFLGIAFDEMKIIHEIKTE